MESFKSLFHLLLVLVCVCVDPTNAQETSGMTDYDEDVSSCSSFDSLCYVSDSVSPMPSTEYSIPWSEHERLTCRCLGQVSCADSNKFLVLDLLLPEERVKSSLTFCNEFEIPERICNKTEIAVTSYGRIRTPVEIVEDVKCRCSDDLVLVKTVRELDPVMSGYCHGYFTCGKTMCDVCKSDPPACERVTPAETEQPCRCPYGYSCDRDPSQLPVTQGEVKFYCQPTEE